MSFYYANVEPVNNLHPVLTTRQSIGVFNTRQSVGVFTTRQSVGVFTTRQSVGVRSVHVSQQEAEYWRREETDGRDSSRVRPTS